ncbi:ShlB/FhaC/HecB family hemolysin secretion/activation protein [Novosphingobium terrae]|uniref:ShlB/FhaC/HecB family hemolysin secretion/activation protein n=1 Tax=Novosphingobium terrae TaxID=2726189 RepID=UPI001980406C|nr:ShlB/FhaC/HecB family hemolysin secretion/activation protein [Novosphingobium terrae]
MFELLLTGTLLAGAVASTPPLIIDSGRADRVQTPNLPPRMPEKPVEQRAKVLSRVDATGSDQPIKGIRFLGDLVPAPVAHAAERFVGQPARRDTLERLAAAMSDAYATSDVALYTVAIPDQNLSGGRVIVRVAQGFIEGITYPDGSTPLIRAYAQHLLGMKPLRRSALERELSLMRDIAGATVSADLLRGRQPGGVILSLKVKRKHLDGSLAYDNSRSQLLGQGQFNATLAGNSLLRDGDETKLNVMVARNFRSFIYTALTHATPLGHDGLKLTLSGAWLQTNVPEYNLRGHAVVGGASLSYPVIRGYRKNLTVSAGLDVLNSDSALFGTVASSDHIRTLRVAAGYSWAGKKTVWSLGSTVSQGLAILNDRGLVGQSDPRFTKVNASASYDRAFGKHVVLRLKAQGQYSHNQLPATERIAFGGSDYGRAFDTAAITADSGGTGSLELALRPKLGKRLNGTEIYGFVDHARLRINDRVGVPASSWDLGSAGGGIRLAWNDWAVIGVEGAKAVTDPFHGALGDWRVNVSWKISRPQVRK